MLVAVLKKLNDPRNKAVGCVENQPVTKPNISLALVKPVTKMQRARSKLTLSLAGEGRSCLCGHLKVSSSMPPALGLATPETLRSALQSVLALLGAP